MTDAEAIAAAYDFDVNALLFEVNRRSAGSFTTTVAGSPEWRDRYSAAWQFAVARQRAARLQQAAE